MLKIVLSLASDICRDARSRIWSDLPAFVSIKNLLVAIGQAVQILWIQLPTSPRRSLSMIEWKISQQLSKTYDGRRHPNWPRLCAIAILTLSVVDASMLPTDGVSSMSSYDSFRALRSRIGRQAHRFFTQLELA